jgi:ribosomal protein S18 acetylase RimI-like enzyme
VIAVRPLAAHEWQLLRDARIQSLVDAPRQFGVTEEEARALPDGEWQAMVAEGEAGQLGHVVVATSGTEPVGLAIIERDRFERRQHRARVWAVWVHRDFRGRGVGRRLMTALLDWARARGVVAVYLDVVVGNDPARSLYERLGFVRRDLDPYSLRIDGEFVAQEKLVLVLGPPGRGR